MKPQDRPHYVNNAQFSQAVVDYVTILNEARNKEEQLPIVPDYIASCFLKIAEGLSHKANFIRYTYREETVMDAVEKKYGQQIKVIFFILYFQDWRVSLRLARGLSPL